MYRGKARWRWFGTCGNWRATMLYLMAWRRQCKQLYGKDYRNIQ